MKHAVQTEPQRVYPRTRLLPLTRAFAFTVAGASLLLFTGCGEKPGSSGDISSEPSSSSMSSSESISSGEASDASSSDASSSDASSDTSSLSSSAASSTKSSSGASASSGGDSDVVPTGAGTGYGYKGSDWRLRVPNIELPLTAAEKPGLAVCETSGGTSYYLDARATDEFKAMMAAAKRDGMNLYVSSAYRSIERQTELFNQRVQTVMTQGYSRSVAENKVAVHTARPGTSDHNLGLAVDFNGVTDAFANTKEYQWLIAHCAEYGFILRYPSDKASITQVQYEPWHYRYVGKEHASIIMARGLCLEEYVQQLG